MGFALDRDDHTVAGVGRRETTDHARKLASAIRYGVVKEVDYQRAMLRAEVAGGDIISDWVPWFTMRAGADRFWWAPEPGEVVLLLSPDGEMANGLAIPGIVSNANQNAARPSVARMTIADGTVIEYDRKAHQLKLQVKADDVEEPDDVDGDGEAEPSGIDEDPDSTDGDVKVETEGDVTVEAKNAIKLETKEDDIDIDSGRDLKIHVTGNFQIVVDGDSDTTVDVIGNADLRIATLGRVDIYGASGLHLNESTWGGL